MCKRQGNSYYSSSSSDACRAKQRSSPFYAVITTKYCCIRHKKGVTYGAENTGLHLSISLSLMSRALSWEKRPWRDYRITQKSNQTVPYGRWTRPNQSKTEKSKQNLAFYVQTCTFVKLAKWNKVIRRRRHIWKRRLSMGPCRKLDWELFWVFTAGVKPHTLLSPYCLGITSKQSTNEEKEVERRPEGFLPPSFHKSSR